MTILFATSVKKSKRILTYRKLLFSNIGSLKPFNVSSALENILQIKEINVEINNSAIDYSRKLATITNITNSLHGIRLVNIVASKFESMRKEQFNKNNKNHLITLDKLWLALKPDVRRTPQTDPSGSSPALLLSADWSEIGFQRSDPSTDFRGMGLLGLMQLVYFCECKPNVARSILTVSSDPQKYYPFAITGINITAFLLELLNGTHLHRLIFDNIEKLALENAGKFAADGCSSDSEAITSSCNVLNEFYCFIFEEFHNLWQARNPRNVMDFPKIFNELKNDIRYNFPAL